MTTQEYTLCDDHQESVHRDERGSKIEGKKSVTLRAFALENEGEREEASVVCTRVSIKTVVRYMAGWLASKEQMLFSVPISVRRRSFRFLGPFGLHA